MDSERLHIVRVEIEYSAYDNVVLYYNLEKESNMDAYNLFRHNEPLGIYTTQVTIRLLDDAEWKSYKESGKVNGETVWEGFPT